MTEKYTSDEIKDAVVRICPACGVVNPAGPSETCPHLQLIRFKGVDDTLEDLLARVAAVRVQYQSHLDELRAHVMRAAQRGEAEVLATQKHRFSEVQTVRKAPRPLVLTNPDAEENKKSHKTRKQHKTASPPPVDPRQLALIAREPPQGDA